MITGTEMVNIRHECLGVKISITTSEERQNCTLPHNDIYGTTGFTASWCGDLIWRIPRFLRKKFKFELVTNIYVKSKIILQLL